MNRLNFAIVVFVLSVAGARFATAAQVESQSNPVAAGTIVIDGAVGDWAGVPCFVADPAGEDATGYDLARYCIANDNANFYVRVGIHAQGAAALEAGAGLWTWFDTDKNADTGIRGAFLASGLGAEWNGSGMSQFNGWNSAGGHTGSILGTAVSGARSGDLLEYEYAIPRTVFGVDSFFTSAQSEVGGGDIAPDGAGNFFEYHATAAPLPPISYTYESNSAIAHAPPAGGALGDPGRSKLIDGVANNANWLSGDTQWVGVQDPAFVPANLAGDTELPQPRIEFSFDSSKLLSSVAITYLVDDEAKLVAPDSVVVSFSNGGSAFGSEVASFGFDNSDDNLADPVGTGAIRTLTLDLGGVAADKVRLDFFNDFEWSAIGEVSFTAVPEPSSVVMCLLGGWGLLAVARRRRVG
jgi:hypothetical protein